MTTVDTYVKNLLHFEGADAGTTFTDELGKTWTARGNAQIDTAQQKYGFASGLFDGTGDYIDTPDHADFTIVSKFTVDFWLRLNGSGLYFICGQGGAVDTTQCPFSLQTGGASGLILTYTNSLGYYWSMGSGSSLTPGTWMHVAVVKNDAIAYLFLDGVLKVSHNWTTNETGNMYNSASKFSIGRNGEYDGIYLNGWIDEFRFSNGIARWTSDFTPTGPYGRDFVPNISVMDGG